MDVTRANGWAKRLRLCLALLSAVALMAALAWVRVAAGQEPEPAAGPEPGSAANRSDAAGAAYLLDVKGPIGPATRDFVVRSLERAAEGDASIVILRMDTPGGLDASTRDIVKAILASSVPVATWVAPAGARAASAGTYILYASHVAAMSGATNIGAATPVQMIGGSAGKDKKPRADSGKGDGTGDGTGEDTADDDKETGAEGDAMSRKVVNDAVAWIRGLAEKRGRNAEWAERAVRQAESITSEQALELGVIDFIAENVEDLLAQADGRLVLVGESEVELNTRNAAIEQVEPDWRNELLAVITSPTIAYMLLLIGVYGLILEGYHPGAILPGVVGAICLLLALYALQMLPVNYAGLGLIVLGVILIIAETMAPSFGALGFGGIIAIVIGSIILIDTDVPGFGISRPLVGGIAAAASVGLLVILWLAVRSRDRPVVSGREELVGADGVALEDFGGEGHVYVHSERWNAIAESPVTAGQKVVVTAIDGLTLKVRPAKTATQEQQNV